MDNERERDIIEFLDVTKFPFRYIAENKQRVVSIYLKFSTSVSPFRRSPMRSKRS